MVAVQDELRDRDPESLSGFGEMQESVGSIHKSPQTSRDPFHLYCIGFLHQMYITTTELA